MSHVILLPARAVAKYCDEYVCVCVGLSVREDISGTTRAIVATFMHGAYGRGSVLLWRRCDTLYTSGFVDEIMFFL